MQFYVCTDHLCNTEVGLKLNTKCCEKPQTTPADTDLTQSTRQEPERILPRTIDIIDTELQLLDFLKEIVHLNTFGKLRIQAVLNGFCSSNLQKIYNQSTHVIVAQW